MTSPAPTPWVAAVIKESAATFNPTCLAIKTDEVPDAEAPKAKSSATFSLAVDIQIGFKLSMISLIGYPITPVATPTPASSIPYVSAFTPSIFTISVIDSVVFPRKQHAYSELRDFFLRNLFSFFSM